MGERASRLLLVDDNQVDRVKLSRILEGEGHAVDACDDGRKALELLRSESFDLVLLDIAMPDMDGYHVLDAMKADSSLRSTPVIAISASDASDVAVKCKDLGADDYVSKSSGPDVLKARVAACLER